MNQYFKVTQDVADALGKGKHLCPHCLGGKALMVWITGDFLGDFSGYKIIKCEHCNATGLEEKE